MDALDHETIDREDAQLEASHRYFGGVRTFSRPASQPSTPFVYHLENRRSDGPPHSALCMTGALMSTTSLSEGVNEVSRPPDS